MDENVLYPRFSPPFKVHGNIHGLLGGAFHCSVDMNEFHNQHAEKYSPGLLTFILEYMTANEWPSNSFMPDDNDCDSDCVRGQGESCGCTCRVDAFSLSEDEVITMTIFESIALMYS